MSASSPLPRIHTAARPGVAHSLNEDLIITLPNAVIVLDGATSVEHGPGSGGWYADVLGRALARRLPAPRCSLPHLLADAIADIVRTHQLQPSRSPSAALTMTRWDDNHVDALVLCDTTLAVLDGDNEVMLLHDDRLHRIDNPVRAAYLRSIGDGASFDSERLREMQAITRAHRNRDGGYWVAEATPDAAFHALCHSWPREQVHALALATDGAASAVTPYQVMSCWPQLIAAVLEHGPDTVLDAAHHAEAGDLRARRWPRFKVHDDKALAIADFTTPSGAAS
ncbi:protein phosphatase 2C domain-containing protein [Nonomuraea sp. CA-143628]|uniref:protein phosphatase 2C domain-containing protein n=1 Tax=Nonomuraea sp. CA-143628 TaxID=3239997 RepID=UPI003D923648